MTLSTTVDRLFCMFAPAFSRRSSLEPAQRIWRRRQLPLPMAETPKSNQSRQTLVSTPSSLLFHGELSCGYSSTEAKLFNPGCSVQ